jgi:hypothetical protein
MAIKTLFWVWFALSEVILTYLTYSSRRIAGSGVLEELDPLDGEYFISADHRHLLEADPLKSAYSLLHRCRDAGEAYSASYLIHKEHILHHKTDYHLKWVNCEMASFIMMNARGHHLKTVNGSVLQSVDVLDFSVIHLSTYERLLNRWRFSNKEVDKDRGNLAPVMDSAKILRDWTSKLHQTGQPVRAEALNRTVVIMPYLGRLVIIIAAAFS